MADRTETPNVEQTKESSSLQSAVDALVMPVLLPCPFCGAPGEIIFAPSKWKPHMQIKVICSSQCDGIDEEWWDKESSKRAVEVWNTRAPLPVDDDKLSDAAYSFVGKLTEFADSCNGTAPLWYGWAIRDAFIAGVNAAKSGQLDATQPERA